MNSSSSTQTTMYRININNRSLVNMLSSNNNYSFPFRVRFVLFAASLLNTNLPSGSAYEYIHFTRKCL